MHDDFARFWASGEFDNREIILELLTLNNEKARILWYNTYAEFSLKRKMASSPEEVVSLLSEIQEKWAQKAKKEFAMIEEFFWLESWAIWYPDILYYMRKYKEEKLHFDESLFKKYFEYNQTVQWMLDIASRLYDVSFEEIKESDFEYSDDLTIFSVKKDGQLISYFICDFFYRPEKDWGAWAWVMRSRFWKNDDKIIPVVYNTGNFQKNNDGDTLLSENEVTTMFHEFGHWLHEMLSKTGYAELTWFWVERDFVELPSQLMENRAKESESLQTFARHHETQEIIPNDLLDTLKEKSQFWKWYFLARQWELALLDMMLYSWVVPKTVKELDEKIMTFVNSVGVFPREESYKMYTGFAHIFWWWYEAWYYSYMRAEIVEAQVLEIFKEKWMFDKETATRFLETILGAWSKEPAEVMFKKFTGKNVSRDAHLKRYWLL